MALGNYLQLAQNMGLRYVSFRAWRAVQTRTGLLKKRFPTHPPRQTFISRDAWKNQESRFFSFSPPAALPLAESDALQNRVRALHQGTLTFFSAQVYEVTDWLTNPATGYRYDASKHWTEIPDFSAKAGDIKYVWEKSRFAFLYDLIRYDFHFQKDQSERVFEEIESWIAENPVNQGPNWRCSQEISLRTLNWTFALHYYKNSSALTETRFARIVQSLYRQMQHVEENIQFSRRAVRNNHALTETLTLYLVGLLYPFFPESVRWKTKGKCWFEQEVAYQIYEDGTFLQFSMNYHRVVVQLLTWGIQLAHLNGEQWTMVVYERARKSLQFLLTCQDATTGWLPNYGTNDGALFFPLTECHFRDYRPQLYALAQVLGQASPYPPGIWQEEADWLGLGRSEYSSEPGLVVTKAPVTEDVPDGTYAFDKGGYYVLRDGGTLTFLRCGHYTDRPFQADNLHLDIWENGENILRDAGSYLYNTDEQWTRYFAGTSSHNTVMLGTFDQMRRGPRFIWFDWIKESRAGWFQSNAYIFEGEFTGFYQSGQPVTHRRRVTKQAGKNRWLVEDWLHHAPAEVPMHQIWHPGATFLDNYSIKSFDQQRVELTADETEGWYSEKYGQKVGVPRLVFSTPGRYLKTEISLIANR
ncbi:heparinase [Cytophagaceae bacterium SJW1-29]|uniref:Heparinase n=2 Tax=Salmonirosea aquatica TaxID=2654236 RepID=A0A7C9BH26_9BACT|nr:heparinase [Cytophagaceae bacterium SJW1-29]